MFSIITANDFLKKAEADVAALHAEKVEGWGMGPWGVGPYGMAYLLIDLGEQAGEDRWKVAHTTFAETADAWRAFFTAQKIP